MSSIFQVLGTLCLNPLASDLSWSIDILLTTLTLQLFKQLT